MTTEVFEVTPCLHVVELRKSSGDVALYRELCRKLSGNLSSDNLPSGNVNFEEDNSVWRAEEGVTCSSY